MQTWIWFVLAGICAAIEILSFNLVFASFAFGAIGAGVVSLITNKPAAPWLSIALFSVLSLTLLRPRFLKYIFRKTPPSDTGVQALIGSSASTSSEVTDTSGRIVLHNETWSARSEGGRIPEGVLVKVKRIDGALAIVELLDTKRTE